MSLHPSAPALRRWREDNEGGLAFDAVREPGLGLYRAMGLGKSLQKVDSTRFAHFFTLFTRTTYKKVFSYRGLRRYGEIVAKKHFEKGEKKEDESKSDDKNEEEGPQDRENVLQMGGNLVLERDTGAVLMAHRSKIPRDRPSVDEIIAVTMRK